MTELLKKAFRAASRLPPEQQDAEGTMLLAALESERQWDEASARHSQPRRVRPRGWTAGGSLPLRGAVRSDVALYSAFNTSIGSTRTARLTGSAEAAKHVESDTGTVTASTNGSVGSTL